MSILSFRTAATCSKISENRFFRNFHKFSTKKKNFIIEYSPEVTKCTEFYKPEKFREISGKKHAKNTVFIEKSVKTVSFFGKRQVKNFRENWSPSARKPIPGFSEKIYSEKRPCTKVHNFAPAFSGNSGKFCLSKFRAFLQSTFREISENFGKFATKIVSGKIPKKGLFWGCVQNGVVFWSF